MPELDMSDFYCFRIGGKIVCFDCIDEVDSGDLKNENIVTLQEAQESGNLFICDYCEKPLIKTK